MINKVSIFFVGPGKTGTSWIYNVLKHHPEIEVSSAKETLYFTDEFDRGEDWYHKHWVSNDKIRAEFSNTYSYDNEAVNRIYQYNYKAKIIFTCRNPLDRIISHAKFLIRNGSKLSHFKDLVRDRPDMLERSDYWKMIQRYRKRFSDKNIGVFFFEDMKKDNLEYINQLCFFVGVNGFEELPELTHSAKLPSSLPRSSGVIRFLKYFVKVFRSCGLARLIQKVKFNPFLMKILFTPWEDGRLIYSHDDIDMIRKSLSESNERLATFTKSKYPLEW